MKVRNKFTDPDKSVDRGMAGNLEVTLGAIETPGLA